MPHLLAMSVLGIGLLDADQYEDALSVQEAELSMLRRTGASAKNILASMSNIATTYEMLGRLEEALPIKTDVYSGFVKLYGKQHRSTLLCASNYALSLCKLGREEEGKSLIRKTMPLAQRVLGETDDVTLGMRKLYGMTLYRDPSAALDDLREAVTTLEDTERIARRVLGGAHPEVMDIERKLRQSRAALRARETPPSDSREDGDLDGVENA